METVIIVVHLMAVVALVVVILMQKSEGGALGIGGGGGGGGNANFLTGRGTANVLTRTTTFLAIVFFATSIGLTLIAQNGGGGSILDGAPITRDATPTPTSGPQTTEELIQQLPGGSDIAPEPSGPEVPLSQ